MIISNYELIFILRNTQGIGTLKSDKMMCYLNIYVIFILFKYFIKQNLIAPVFILFIYFVMEILCIKAYE